MMSTSTRGISLHYYKYSDNSVISKIFTKEFGLKSYVVKGIKNKKSKNKLGLLKPLNLIQIEVTNNPKQNIQYIKEIRISEVFPDYLINMKKQFLSMFISEILMKVLVESEISINLYQFIENTAKNINTLENINKNFPIIFLIKLTSHLGFFPSNSNENMEYFDLENGCFTNNPSYFNISGENKDYLVSLLNDEDITIPILNRKELLKSIQKYYKLHHYNIENLKSYEVIESLRS